MRKELLITITLLIALPAFAELTVGDTVSTNYLKNHGYSSSIIKATHKNIAQMNGETLEEPIESEYYSNPVIKCFRRIWMYLDPSLDDHSFVNDHDIKTSPSYKDL